MTGKIFFKRLAVLDNRLRTGNYTWQGLADACKDALALEQPPSRRTILSDIEYLRDTCAAPIPKGQATYYYTDRSFSIANLPLSMAQTKDVINALDILKSSGQLAMFESLHASFMTPKIQKNAAYFVKQKQPIAFDPVNIVEGMSFLSPLYQAILEESAIELAYQSFKAVEPKHLIFHPYFLKEYNQRWFLFGLNDTSQLIENRPLDRIKGVVRSTLAYKPCPVDFEDYFRNLVGVSRTEQSIIEKICLRFAHKRARYVETKPIHTSQRKIADTAKGVFFEFDLIINQELEAKILEFGEDVCVMSPDTLKISIINILNSALDNYK